MAESTGRESAAPTPPRLWQPLFRQFAQPTGLLGRLAGLIMAKSDADDRWVVDLLDVQPDDRVLDVGCGPGVTVRLLIDRATEGHVCGVDPSVTMLGQAAARNRAAVQARRVELRCGTAAALPYPDATFTKACAVHSVYFWPSLEDGLCELYRVLAPGGRLILAIRMRQRDAVIFAPSRYGWTDAQVTALETQLGAVGFHDVGSQRREIGRETITAIRARR